MLFSVVANKHKGNTMKFSLFLVNELKNLKIKYNVKKITIRSKHTEVLKRIKQITTLTNFLDKNTKLSIRCYCLINGIKSYNKCSICGCTIKNPKSQTCSRKCGRVISEQKRDSKAAAAKSVITMKNTFVNGVSLLELRSKKSVKTMAKILSDGTTIYKNASIKSIKTRKKNNSNSAATLWNNLSELDRKLLIAKRNKSSRKTNELLGRWTPKILVDDYKLYFSASKFNHGFNITKYTTDKEIKLLNENGVFNNRTNTKGCVRDHLLSRRYGYNNNIPTWIISHPANCEIILHSENVRRSFTDDNLLSLDVLLQKIYK